MAQHQFMSSRFFDSKCRPAFPDKKEKILGYLLGPIGAQLLYFLIQTWLNVYYTDVLGLTAINPDFLFYFPLISGIVVVILNILFGYLIDRTKTRQGKARPYIFLSALILPLSGLLLFLIPTDNVTAEYCFICLSFNFFFSCAYAIYNSAYNLLVPLSSRNSRTRNALSTLANLGMMIAQALGSLFPTLIYPYIGTDKTLWFFAMMGLSLLALPFTLLEYYHTRERVSEETAGTEATQPKVSLKKQFGAVTKDRYWWILILYTLIFQLGLAFKNSSVAYYCNWVIGAKYNDGYTMLLFNLIGGLSLGIGAAIINPLAKKFSKQQLMIWGFVFYALGDVLCWVISYPGWFSLPKNTILIIVLVGQFIKNAGAIPCVYIWMSLVGDVLDHLEWKAGFRCDGITVSINTIFALFMPILGNAVINKLLANYGYIAPGSDASGIVQNTILQIVLDSCAVGAEVISSLIIVVLMCFLNVEKNLAKEQLEIQDRHRQETEAAGQVWVAPEEKARLEEEEFERQSEEADLAALQPKCEKKHLDFEAEKAKYEQKKAQKAQKGAKQ
jgi:GPH family glycoside/pentoside/hexuronide:cation symporter